MSGGALAKQRRAKCAASTFGAGAEAANLTLRLQSFDFDRLRELVDGDVARIVANFQPQENLPRAARIIFPVILARVGQASRDGLERAVGPIANRQCDRPAAEIRVVGPPADIKLSCCFIL